MNHFLATLELCSAVGTPLAADVLWGHIAWGIRYHSGNEALEDWLAFYDEGQPPLVLSDPFPAGTFPRPCLPAQPRPERPPQRQELQRFKQLKKLEAISHAVWDQVAGDLSPQALSEALVGQLSVKPVSVSMTHAGVNRLTGGTGNVDGGSLYSTRQLVYPTGTRFEVWGHSPESLDRVRDWIEWGIEGGYGRDASSGMGHLKLHSLQQRTLPECEGSNAIMLLGPVVPRPEDPSRGFFKTTIKSGRLGGAFAIGEIPGGTTQRQKYPVTMLSAGSVLLTENRPESLGRVLSGIHEWKKIRQYGMAPVLPLRLSSELLQNPLLNPN